MPGKVFPLTSAFHLLVCLLLGDPASCCRAIVRAALFFFFLCFLLTFLPATQCTLVRFSQPFWTRSTFASSQRSFHAPGVMHRKYKRCCLLFERL